MLTAGLAHWLSSIVDVAPHPLESYHAVIRACQFGAPPDLLVVLARIVQQALGVTSRVWCGGVVVVLVGFTVV